LLKSLFFWMNLCKLGTTSFTASSAIASLPRASSGNTLTARCRSAISSSRSKNRVNLSFVAAFPLPPPPLPGPSPRTWSRGEKLASK
jgi:hypothetical protein